VQLISYRGRPVAVVVNGDLAVIDPRLDRGDPLWRFTAAMCRLAMEIELGIAAAPYEDSRAERYARELLIPAERLGSLSARVPEQIAARFGVPLEQADARQVELGL
jgi:hypothetical protein